MPVVRNSSMKAAKNELAFPGSVPEGRQASTASAAASITTKFQNVTRAPPSRSASQPPSGRISAPASGPANAYLSRPEPGYWVASSVGNAAANPMNEPNVPP